MSHIPSSAMPHAGDIHVENETNSKGEDGREEDGTGLMDRAGKLADKARERPGMAAAAGAAVIAGVAAAAAVPLMRHWGKSSSASKSRSSKTKKNA